MPQRTYADLLALWEATTPEPEPAIAGGPGGGTSTAGGTGAASDIKPNEADDDPHRLARLNLERYATLRDGRTLRYWRGEWISWRRDRDRKLAKAELQAKLNASIKGEFDRLNVEAINHYLDKKRFGEIDDSNDKGPPEAKKVLPQVVSAALDAMASMVVVPDSVELGTWLPDRSRRNYLSMKNGLLDIDAVLAGKEECECLLSHSPNWFSLVAVPYGFDSTAGSEPETWLRYLRRVLEDDQERINMLQEWAGYLLLPDMGQQRFLILIGDGGNGKSVCEAGLTAMLGNENVSNVSLEMFGSRFHLTATLGKLANFCGDCGEIDKVAEGHLKCFTAGNRMFFDRKGLSGINAVPTARLVVSCNKMPQFSDRTDGIWRRVIPIPFDTKIAEAERVYGMDNQKFWEDSGELPAMFNWALLGLERLRQQKTFTESKAVNEKREEFRSELNPARAFLQQFVQLSDNGAFIPIKLLYYFYQQWTKEAGYQGRLSEVNLGREVRRQFGKSVKRDRLSYAGRPWVYTGLDFTEAEICGHDVNKMRENPNPGVPKF